MDSRDRRSIASSDAVSLASLLIAKYIRTKNRRLGQFSLAFLLVVSTQLLVVDNLSGEMAVTSSKGIRPEQYGNLYLTRKCITAGKEGILFTHWTHRMDFTCRICHLELGFPMEVNGVDITMEKNRSGKFCGFCHDGKKAFGTTDEDCQKCHYGNKEYDYGDKIDRLEWMPENPYGNGVDWSAALEEGDIKPIFCFDGELCKVFDFEQPVEIEMAINSEEVPPVVFLHERHSFWLDCLNCHPGNLANRGGKVRFPKQGRNRQEFCRGCHGRAAFPMDNCQRCHPEMDND